VVNESGGKSGFVLNFIPGEMFLMFVDSFVAEKLAAVKNRVLACCARVLALLWSFLKSFSSELGGYFANLCAKNQKWRCFSTLHEAFFTLDSAIAFFSLYATAFLFEDGFSEYSSGFLAKNMLVFLLLSTSSFVFLKTQAFAFYENARKELAPLFVAIALSTAAYYPLMLLMGQLESFSLMTPFLNLFVCVALLLGARFALISIKGLWKSQEAPPAIKQKVAKRRGQATLPIRSLIIGDIVDIHAFLTDGNGSIRDRFEVVAIVANPPENFGKHMSGIPIANDIKALHESHGINFMDDLDAVLTINGSNVFLSKLRRFCSIHRKSLFEISAPDKAIPDPNNDEQGYYQKTKI
jgi:hypothetical protein